tara:strand:+ start:315 stop:755 length:441 start_codon:yes stop_codon:yes gene_type:complete
LSILIPAYNEASTIHLILNKLKTVVLPNGITKEIIIENDYSSNDTVLKIEKYRANNADMTTQLYYQEKIMGKGAATHKIVELATGEYLIIHDADLAYDPEEYNLLLKAILTGFTDIVYGSTFIVRNPNKILFILRSIRNKVFNQPL